MALSIGDVMAANLTLQYYKAEEVYRLAQTTQDRIVALQEMLRVIPKHKGTDHLQGALRAKLAETQRQYKAELSTPKGGRSYRIPRQGCGTAIVVGGPNAGKSRLVAELTGANPEVAEYPFTTREPQAGILNLDGVRIQLIDTPPVTDSFLEPYLVDFVRTADLVLCCLDGSRDESIEETLCLIEQFAQRKTRFALSSGFDERDFSIVHVKTMLVVTRGDDDSASLRQALFAEACRNPFVPVVAELSRPDSCHQLAKAIFGALNKIRIFTKKPGEQVDRSEPFVLAHGGTVSDLAECVHEDIARSLKSAKVWRAENASPIVVGRDYPLQDGDIVELNA